MGELWRSQKMSLIQLFIQIDAAHDTVAGLGERGIVEFKDVSYSRRMFLVLNSFF